MRYIYGINRRLAMMLALCILLPCFLAFCVIAVLHTDDIYETLNSEIQQVFETVNENAREHMIKVSQQTRFILSYEEINNVLRRNESIRITPEVLEHNREISNVIDALMAESNATEIKIYTTNENAAYLSCVDYVDETVFSHLSEASEGEWLLENSDLGQKLCFYWKHNVVPEYYNVIEITFPFRKIIDDFGTIKYKNTYINIENVTFTYDAGKYREETLPESEISITL